MFNLLGAILGLLFALVVYIMRKYVNKFVLSLGWINFVLGLFNLAFYIIGVINA